MRVQQYYSSPSVSTSVYFNNQQNSYGNMHDTGNVFGSPPFPSNATKPMDNAGVKVNGGSIEKSSNTRGTEF